MVVDCTGWLEPLNLECLLVNTFVGTADLFIFLAIIAIATIAMTFRMMNTTILIMFALFAVIMSGFMTGIYFLVVLIAGLIVASAIGKIAKVSPS